MTRIEVFPNKRGKESHPYLIWTLALLLIGLCIWASHWQYSRGVARHHRNAIIASHINLPTTSLQSVESDLNAAEWRRIEVAGVFEPNHQILLRNKYFDGKYGFELLTLFRDLAGRSYWVDRGWVAPGATATQPPLLPNTSTQQLTLTGRLRLDRSLPQGSFFAVSSGGGKLIEKWNAQSKTNIKTENFYLDLLKASDATMDPAAPVELPELTDGPHMAYALQWLFFGGLVFYGRLLLRRSR